MKRPNPSYVDFETWAIEDRPRYPPIPTSVSICLPKGKPKCYAWGHLTNNNCTWGEARAAIVEAYAAADGVCFHHGKFDVDVAEVHFGLEPPPWDKIHDTLFLAYLDDPHQRNLGLKPLAERLLGEPPEEQDAVVEWLVTHQPVPGVKISRSKQSKTYAMKYLPWAPGDLVGTYANGDIARTKKVFELLWPKTQERGMLRAYAREQELMPLLLAAERLGVCVDVRRLRADQLLYSIWLQKIDAYLLKRLKADAEFNLDSGTQLITRLIELDLADEELVGLTANGKLASDKATFRRAVKDKSLGSLLAYRAELCTCLRTYMGPWLTMAEATGGTIHTQFNQTMSPDGGTRTGRLSCTWFMNMPKEFTPLFTEKAGDKLPKPPRGLEGLPSLPICRGYVVPRPGYVFVDRDYSQQEPRILAHFDGGQLLDAYTENPWIDLHDYAKMELEKFGLFYERKPVKNTNLGLIYGMGKGKLAEKNDMTVEEAGALKDAVLKLYPGLKAMYKDMKVRAASNEPIRTWGGREYYCEAPRIVEGRIRQFDYKLVNVLIQGSAADCTKEAIIRYHKVKSANEHFLLPVHDQQLCEVPKAQLHPGMERLRTSMESIEFEVKMLSEGDWSPDNWGALRPYDKKGKRLEAA
jgi:DNA polymerase I-like protein with 3'-5' exonuclease and polymerase domains